MEGEKRSRSPNYPAISLPDAIERLNLLVEAIGTHAAPRELIAKGMGYASLSGASASAVSALQKFGLLDKSGGDWRVSQRGLEIVHPNSPSERPQAIAAAAFTPPLFAELRDKFPGRVIHDDLIKNYLVRNGFSSGAISLIIPAYRQTVQFAETESEGYDSSRELVPAEHSQMQPQTQQALTLPSSGNTPLPQGDPFRLSLAPGRLQGVFDLRTEADADDMIQAINAWKGLVRAKPNEDEEAAN